MNEIAWSGQITTESEGQAEYEQTRVSMQAIQTVVKSYCLTLSWTCLGVLLMSRCSSGSCLALSREAPPVSLKNFLRILSPSSVNFTCFFSISGSGVFWVTNVEAFLPQMAHCLVGSDSLHPMRCSKCPLSSMSALFDKPLHIAG